MMGIDSGILPYHISHRLDFGLVRLWSRSRSSLVVESLSLMREAWVRSSAAPTKALEQGLNLHLLLGPYLDGAPACLN